MQATSEIGQKPQPDNEPQTQIEVEEKAENASPPGPQEDLEVEISNVTLKDGEIDEGNFDLVQLYTGEPYQRHFYPMIHYSHHASLFQYDITRSLPGKMADGESTERAWVTGLSEGEGASSAWVEDMDTFEVSEEDLEELPELIEIDG
ncbi:hypothetical protein V5O48_014735 [Marasmius crinis-equi]|uniref:Uncharacterized protein n=1 Tax=Marasmius crinis-equi TaxID=585013 RepID=A0ABR3EWH4_9AGAR